MDDIDTIVRELALVPADLASKPQVVAANKIDALDEPERLERLVARAEALGLPLFRISAVSGTGVPELLEAIWRRVAERGGPLAAERPSLPGPEPGPGAGRDE